MKIKVMEEKEASYVVIDVAVRYEDEDMPFDAPMRVDNFWRAMINLSEKRVLDWPIGKTLSFEMKVCDEGIYKLLDTNLEEIKRIDGYVPNNLLPGEFGDYLTLDIDENGVILNWLPSANLSDFQEVVTDG